MCSTCATLRLERCPPPPSGAGPDDELAEEILLEAAIRGRRQGRGTPAIDSLAELVLRIELGETDGVPHGRCGSQN